MSSIQDSNLFAEKRTDRIKPGTTHPLFGAIPSKGCIPLPQNKTGRLYSSGTKLLGVGTSFLTQVDQGDHIYYNGVVRRIAHVLTDKLIDLEYAFPVNFSNEVFYVPQRNKYNMVTIKNSDTTNAVTLQETPFVATELVVTGGAPITYDIGSGGLEFTCSL